MLKIVIGLMLCLVALWGGAYALYVIEYESWMHFPAYMTAVFSAAGGVVLIAIGVADLAFKKS
jgi:hypothetical protein